ncbi:MAG: ABC transporter ATP-binding protein [Acidimicrobiales bacterium]
MGPTSDAEAAIVVLGLTKSYGDVEAVRGVDLTVARGEIFALLGPNGAGKTSTVEILEGYRKRDGGTVSVLGLDPGTDAPRLRAQIGIVLQSAGMNGYLTVRETLAMTAGYYPHSRSVDDVLGLVGLEEKADTRVLRLSGGQQRRLDVGLALVGDPDLLFLDEPTTGFDPSARREAWEVVRNLARLGKTVLLTTHYMEEAQALAGRVAVIAGGRIVAEGTPDSLGGRASMRPVIRFRPPPGATPPPGLAVAAGPDGQARCTPDDLTAALHQLTGWAIDGGFELTELEVLRPSLEDVYLQLTGMALEAVPDDGSSLSPKIAGRRRRRR